MNIETKKLRLIEWIAKVQDTKVIDQLVEFSSNLSKEEDWWDNISESERASIERGLDDIQNGRVVSHSEAKKLYEKYL